MPSGACRVKVSPSFCDPMRSPGRGLSRPWGVVGTGAALVRMLREVLTRPAALRRYDSAVMTAQSCIGMGPGINCRRSGDTMTPVRRCGAARHGLAAHGCRACRAGHRLRTPCGQLVEGERADIDGAVDSLLDQGVDGIVISGPIDEEDCADLSARVDVA